MCEPMWTVQSLGDDTHAVVKRPKWAREHGLHTERRVSLGVGWLQAWPMDRSSKQGRGLTYRIVHHGFFLTYSPLTTRGNRTCMLRSFFCPTDVVGVGFLFFLQR